MRGHFRAGFATADITPDPLEGRVELSGYVARHQPATGLRDRLQAGVLALAVDDRPPVLLVGLDLCILDPTAAERIASTCPVPDEDVLLACSHTHSAPATYPLIGCGEPDPAYLRVLALRVGDAARRALSSLCPCRLGWGRRVVTRPLWGNRRDAAGPTDGRLHLLKVERAESDRAPICALWSVACHPVVLGAENVRVSADFVGEVRAHLPFPSLFLQGCCGDQNPLVRGEDGMGPWGAFAGEVSTLWAVTPTAPSGPWGLAAAAVPLPRLVGDSLEGLPLGEDPVGRAMQAWAQRVAAPGGVVPPSGARLIAGRIGNGRIALWPGEPFVSLQLALPPDTLAVGHAGASVGYVPDRQAYAHPGYEAGSAHRYYGFPSALAPEAGETLVAVTRELLGG